MQERRRRQVRNIPETQPETFQEYMQKYGPVQGYFKYSSALRASEVIQSPADAYLQKLQDIMAALVAQGLSEDTAYSILEQTSEYLANTDPNAIEWEDLPYYNRINSLDYPQFLEEQVQKGTKYQESLAAEEAKSKRTAYEKELNWTNYRKQLLPYLNSLGVSDTQKNEILTRSKELLEVGVNPTKLPYYNEAENYRKTIESPEYLKNIQEYQNRETRWMPPENRDIPGISDIFRGAKQRFEAEKAEKIAGAQRPQDWIKRWEAENTRFETNVDRFIDRERLQERMAWLKNAIDEQSYYLSKSIESPQTAADVDFYRTNLDPLTSEYARLKSMREAIPGGEIISGAVKPTGTPLAPKWLAGITDTTAGQMIKKGGATPPPTLVSLKRLDPTQRGMYEGYVNWASDNQNTYSLLEEEAYRRAPYSPNINTRWRAVRQ